MRTKYFNFPLNFISNLDKLRYNEIIDWSIINYSHRIKPDDIDVAKQIAYLYYRHYDDLHPEIASDIDFDEYEHYNGFDFEGNFVAERESEWMLEAMKSDSDFKELCTGQVQYKRAKEILNIVGESYSITLNRYFRLESVRNEFERYYGKDVWTSVKTDYLLDAREGKLPENLFRLSCAAKSIIGKRNFTKTYKSVIVMRMMGAKSNNVLHEMLEDPDIYERYKRISSRYHIDKLLSNAVDRRLLSKIGDHRGIFISIKYSTEKLGEEILKKTTARQLIKSQEREARNKIFAARDTTSM